MTIRDGGVDSVRDHAIVLDESRGVGQILDLIGDASVVLIGEATHGTHEFYRTRAHLTQALVASRGFNVVALEADWPDASRAGRWVRGNGPDPSAEAALGDFERFPRWMWRNRPMLRFMEWLREHNLKQPVADRAGIYGLDLYSLHRSMEAVLRYLDRVDPAAAARARRRYACFDVFGDDPQAYGQETTAGMAPSCEREVIAQLVELQRRAADYASRDGRLAADAYFFAEQNALVVSDAERYYRAMFGSGRESWNLRDRHMMSTLEAVIDHVTRMNGSARAVVWAHNSHLGDARATEMGLRGELNIGQLARDRFGTAVLSIGFTTHTGSVTAAGNWDAPAELMAVRPSLAGSYERLFHDTGLGSFVLDLRGPVGAVLSSPRLERAIGVIYRPATERPSHYFSASLANQFDLVIHYDDTRAVEPLELWSRRNADIADTWPTGV
jgi:erythromycin esterase-like protein